MKNRDIAQLELSFRYRAKHDFLLFIKYTKRNFIINWHHQVLAQKLQDFSEGRIKKLMIFLPPQVGKSEMSTRRLPSFILGKNPDLNLAICAYNQTFASQFNRDIQRIMTDQLYVNVFPGTRLNEKNVVTNTGGSYMRNSEVFEIVGHEGRLKSVGIGGALTGTSVDIGIIDDPIKDAMEAYSSTFRDRLWDWYDSVFSTRLHNDSQQLITLTRWHEDDLAGRILKRDSQWEVLILPAIKEDFLCEIDPREIGEALWPEKHSRERMIDISKKNPLIFSSLYQQRPFFNEEEGRFAYAFSRAKHVGRCSWNPGHNTYLSFDFNRNPICCSVIQWFNDTIHIIRCIKLKNSNIYKMCEEILRLYPKALFVVTGDATGQNSTAMVEDNLNYYIIIKQILRLSDGQLKVSSINPKMEANQVLLNALLQNYKWVIDEENASGVIFDLEYVKILPNGTIDKGSRTDPTKQADALDTVRYFCDQFFKWFLKMDSSGLPMAVNQSKSIDPVKAKAGLSELDISAIINGQQLACTRMEYIGIIRGAIIQQARDWIQYGEKVNADTAIKEVERMDVLFGVNGS